MLTKRSTILYILLIVTLVVGAGIMAVAVPAAIGQDSATPAGTRIRVEIAENGSRFIHDETPLFPDGSPAYGNEFVSEGYLYPAGTLTCTNNECNGVLADGSPEFPDLLIGKWVCRGWFVGDGVQTVTGPFVATTQIFDFGEVSGNSSIVTDGFELVDFDVEINRAITGGTGSFRNVRGQQVQALLGINPSFGVVLSTELITIGQ